MRMEGVADHDVVLGRPQEALAEFEAALEAEIVVDVVVGRSVVEVDVPAVVAAPAGIADDDGLLASQVRSGRCRPPGR